MIQFFSFPFLFCFFFFFQWVLSSHSPSSLPQSTSILERGASTHLWWFGFYVWWPSFCGCHPGEALWSPGSVGWGSCVPGSHGTNNWRDSPWQTTTPRALHRQQTETYPQTFWERGLYACPGTLVWGAGFWFGTLIGANRGSLREWRLKNAICFLFFFEYSCCTILYKLGVYNIMIHYF